MPDDIILKAGLDESEVFETLGRIEVRVAKMAKSGARDMQRMGNAMVEAIKVTRTQYEGLAAEMKKGGGAGATEEISKSFNDLAKTIRGLEKPLDVVVKRMQDLQKFSAIDLENIGKPDQPTTRIDVRDAIDKSIASISESVLQDKLTQIMLLGEGVVQASATNMSNYLKNAFNDPTMTGKQLLDLVGQIEARFLSMGKAALNAQTIGTFEGVGVTREEGKDLTAGIFAEEKGEEMLARIDLLMESADDRVKDGAAILKADLQGLLDQGAGAIGGENLMKQVNEIIARYNKLSGLKPINLIGSDEQNDAIKLKNAYEIAGQVYKRITEEGTDAAKERAKVLYDNIKVQKELADAQQQSSTSANAAVRRYLSTLKEVGQFKADDPFAIMLANMDLNALRDRMFKLMDGGNETLKDRASIFKKELTKMINDPPPADQLIARLNEIENEIDELIEKERSAQDLSFSAEGVGGVGGRREDLSEGGKSAAAELQQADLAQRADTMIENTVGVLQDGVLKIRAQLEGVFEIEGVEGQLTLLKDLESQLVKFENIKPAELVRSEQAALLESVRNGVEKVESSYQELVTITGEEGSASVSRNKNAAQAALQRAEANKENTKVLKESLAIVTKSKGAIREKITDAKNLAKEEKKAAEEAAKVAQETREAAEATTALGQAAQKVNVADTYRRLNDVIKQSQALLASTSSEARDVGTALKDAADKGKAALDRGDTSAEELNEELKRMEDLARDAGRAFETNVGGGANRASVSIWKVGNALDRTGVRGAGGIIRIVDAFKGLGPAAIGAAIAIGGVLIVTTKLIEAMVELGKKAAEAFVGFIKGAVETAKSIELTDRLLGSLIKRTDLGPAFRIFLLDESFRVGLDLTEGFARILVPLSDSTDQISEMATQVGILAHAFQQTEDSASRAYKQAAGGQFVTFQKLFGVTPQQIDRIKELQEETDELTGVIQGMREVLESRGLDLSSLEGSLELLTGRFQVLRKVIENTVGTPVRKALARQLESLFDLVEDNGASITRVFESIGGAVEGVIDRFGELALGLTDDISEEDIEDLEESIKALGESIEVIIENITDLFTSEDQNIINLMTRLTDETERLSGFLGRIVGYMGWITKATTKEIKIPGIELGEDKGFDVVDFAEVNKEIATGAVAGGLGAWRAWVKYLGWIQRETKAWGRDEADAFEDIGKESAAFFYVGFLEAIPLIGGLFSGANEVKQQVDAILSEEERLQQMLAVGQREYDFQWIYEPGAFDLGDMDAINDGLDKQAQLTQALAEEWEKYSDAVKKVVDAQRKVQLDYTQQVEDMTIDFGREDLDQATQESQDREDLYRDHAHDLSELEYDRLSDEEKAQRDYQRKNNAAYVKYQDKLVDIDLKAAEKKIDIEQKFREKLEDIKRRFELDAEEAIRRNDAVALLRIRRKMRAELEEAKIARDRAYKEEDKRVDTAADDAKRTYERALRDNATFLDDKEEDIEIADTERRAEMLRQLNWEKKTLEKEHKRQREVIKIEQDRARDDLDLSFKHRQEQMDLQFEEEYKIVEKWKEKETLAMKAALTEQGKVLDATYSMWLAKLGPLGNIIGSIYSGMLFDAENYLTNPNHPFVPGFGNQWNNPDTPEGVSGRLLIPPYVDTPQGGGEQRLRGGFTTAGNVYGVNERGVEAFMATRAGIVLPREAMMLSPNGGAVPGNIDNSKHMQADIDLIDPNQMSPILRTMARSLLTDEILNIGF